MIERVSGFRAAAALLLFFALAAPALPGPGAAAGELPDVEVTDLWDYPENLLSIVAEGTTLVFICDPGVKECREGAVFIDSRARSIREAGARPVMLLRGAAADVRSAALDMHLDTPIYIDEAGDAIDGILDQEILPALILVSPDGTVLDTVYGGGESLAGNIEEILRRGSAEPPAPQVAGPEKKRSNAWKYALGAAAVIAAAAIILVD
jgi:hypothetical protein